MACCYIAVYMISCVIDAADALDVDLQIKYNDTIDQTSTYDPRISYKPDVVASRPTEISVSGMTCAACTGNVERALLEVKDVERVTVSLATNDAKIIHSPKVTAQDLKQAIEASGYGADTTPKSTNERISAIRRNEELRDLRNAFYKMIKANSVLFLINPNKPGLGFINLSLFVNDILQPAGTQMLCAVITLLIWGHYGSWVWHNALSQAKRGMLNMNSLVTLASSMGLLLSLMNLLFIGATAAETYFQTTCGMIMVVTAGKYMELLSRRSATKSLASLYSLLGQTHYAMLEERQQRIPTSMLKPSDRILIEPYRPIPCDCYVVQGASQVNESIATGESLPRSKEVGDFLLAGTKNGPGEMIALLHENTRGSFLRQMLETVEDALANKASVQSDLDIVIRYFVVGVLAIAGLGSLFFFTTAPPDLDFLHRIALAARRAMTILAAACPCALGLATPSATMAGIDIGRQHGLLMAEGAQTMEKLNRVTHIVMDKTGTLTKGELQIDVLDVVHEWHAKADYLAALICAVEENSVAHPAAMAVFGGCLAVAESYWPMYKEHGSLEEHEDIPGKGVQSNVDIGDGMWTKVCLGNASFLEGKGIEVPQGNPGQEKQSVMVYIAIDDGYVGSISLRDTLRQDAKESIIKLRERGLSITMATGDTYTEAKRISSMLGITAVASSAMPNEKLDLIKSLQAKGETVAMIGDGINDAPSIAAADVGIMMAHGKQCLTAGGSIVLLSPHLNALAALFEIAAQTLSQVQFNLYWVFAYNALALSLALGFGSPWGVSLSPTTATMMMSFSSISVMMLGFRFKNRLLQSV